MALAYTLAGVSVLLSVMVGFLLVTGCSFESAGEPGPAGCRQPSGETYAVLLLLMPVAVYLAGGLSVRLKQVAPLAVVSGAALVVYLWLGIRAA